jgi:hypothetical protein
MTIKGGLATLISLVEPVKIGTEADQTIRTVRLSLTLALFAVLSFAPASAGASTRTFVSGGGNDKNSCSSEAPCRTFARAITQTDSGGEIVVMDSAEYGTVSIDRNITIDAANGVYAGVNVPPQKTGINISSPTVTRVELRGLRIISQGADSTGISYSGAGFLYIENCIVDGFYGFTVNKGVGIAIRNAGYVFVKDTSLRNGSTGILAAQGGFGASITLDQVRLEGNNFFGLHLYDKHIATIRNSVLSGNTSAGFLVEAQANSSELNVEECLITRNGTGGKATGNGGSASGIVRISNSTVTHNDVGLVIQGGTVLSAGTNTIRDNQSVFDVMPHDIVGVLVIYKQK